MTISAARIRAVVRKEFRDYRRNRFVLATMAVLPVVFFITPVISIFASPPRYPPRWCERRSASRSCCCC